MLVPCPECQKNISDKAQDCPNCGNPMQHWTGVNQTPTVTQTVIVTPGRNTAIAVLLSILIPGLGQLSKGQPMNGIVWFLGVIFCYAMNVAFGVVVHIACVMGAGMGSKNA